MFYIGQKVQLTGVLCSKVLGECADRMAHFLLQIQCGVAYHGCLALHFHDLICPLYADLFGSCAEEVKQSGVFKIKTISYD
jgi:hypothetical protein